MRDLLIIGGIGVVIYYFLSAKSSLLTPIGGSIRSSVTTAPISVQSISCPTGQVPYRTALGMGPWGCGAPGTVS